MGAAYHSAGLDDVEHDLSYAIGISEEQGEEDSQFALSSAQFRGSWKTKMAEIGILEKSSPYRNGCISTSKNLLFREEVTPP